MALNWYTFQEKICAYFKSLGFDAETNKRVSGIRTHHDIDVFIQTKFIGQEVKWIIEAKKWNCKVNKLHVLGLRTIINDIGVDRGFIISEKGFQTGALEAARNSNVSLLTFKELKEITKDFLENDILKSYLERISLIERRYWSHGKRIRIEYGLRTSIGELEYSVPFVITTAKWAIEKAEKRLYPIDLNTLLEEQHGETIAENFQQLLNWMNLNFNVIDKKILDAEIKMQQDGKFSPKLR